MEFEKGFMKFCGIRLMIIAETIIDGIVCSVILAVVYGVSYFAHLLGLENSSIVTFMEWIEFSVDAVVVLSLGTSTAIRILRNLVYPEFSHDYSLRFKVMDLPQSGTIRAQKDKKNDSKDSDVKKQINKKQRK